MYTILHVASFRSKTFFHLLKLFHIFILLNRQLRTAPWTSVFIRALVLPQTILCVSKNAQSLYNIFRIVTQRQIKLPFFPLQLKKNHNSKATYNVKRLILGLRVSSKFTWHLYLLCEINFRQPHTYSTTDLCMLLLHAYTGVELKQSTYKHTCSILVAGKEATP